MPIGLIAGQSNVSAFGATAAIPYTPTATVQIWTDVNHNGHWDYGDNFNMLVPGVNTGTFARPTGQGAEVGIAKAWLAAGSPGGMLWLGKSAKGETTIVQNGGLDWSPQSDGEMFDEAAFLAACMRANLGVTQLDVVFWMEGETAATSAGLAAAYTAALADFLPAVRAEWMNDANGHVVLGRIGDEAAMPYSLEVRQAQWQADQIDANLESFKTIGMDRLPGGDVHLSSLGEQQLGQAFVDTWLF